MPDKPWKAAERAVEKLLGGQRVSKHSQGEGGADVLGPGLALEVKYKTTLPQWLVEALAQARMASTSELVRLVVIRRKGRKGGIVVMDLEVFGSMYDELMRLRKAVGGWR
ncbi:MAG: hypothetical protein M3Q29_22110 [Chloroflexota bacterium]|nr:hypothetical protein [Chloroflexota bacterium]